VVHDTNTTCDAISVYCITLVALQKVAVFIQSENQFYKDPLELMSVNKDNNVMKSGNFMGYLVYRILTLIYNNLVTQEVIHMYTYKMHMNNSCNSVNFMYSLMDRYKTGPL
jgi:hypothetical protein